MKHLLYFIFSLIFINCSSKSPKGFDDNTLVKIGDRIITKEDFIRRAEYTIRPQLVKGNYYQHKKIILNNLIAEKLLALDFEANNFEIPQKFTDFIKGRKEQAMRQMLYFENGYSKVTLSNDEINIGVKNASKKYQISYFSFPSQGSFGDSLMEAIQKGASLDSIYTYSFKGSIPKREVTWFDENHDKISNLLFDQILNKGDILGPYQFEDNTSFIFRIDGWSNEYDLSGKMESDRYNKVINTLKERKSRDIYRKYIQNVMRGKKVDFNPKVFFPFAEKLKKAFFINNKEKEKAISRALFDENRYLTIDEIEENPETLKNKVLLSINNENWDLGRFEFLMASHPIVFRKNNFSSDEFAKELQLAIVDFIQDYFLTKEAYTLKLNEDSSVKINEQMWNDSYLAFSMFKHYKSVNGLADQDNVLITEIVNMLQSKYEDEIKINMELFESLEISNVDMFVTQGNVPYPVVVPKFPLYTDDSLIDYGSQLNKTF